MRLFNLKYGRLILIAPQKDGSLRSYQLKPEKVLSSDEVPDYLKQMMEREDVKKFFTAVGNI